MTATSLIPAVIGIDPGKDAAIALVSAGDELELLWYRDVFCHDNGHRNEASALYTADATAHGECHYVHTVALEDQFKGSQGMRGFIKLCKRSGRWWGAIDSALDWDVNFEYTLPRAWQSILKKDRRGTKAASKQFVKDNFGISVSEHVADAIGMACYWAGKIRND